MKAEEWLSSLDPIGWRFGLERITALLVELGNPQHSFESIHVVGTGASGVLAAYAALWEPQIDGVIISRPPLSHMDDGAPPLLNVLRVCDIPDVLGMLAPRSLTIHGAPPEKLSKTAAVYKTAGQPARLAIRDE